MEVSLIGPLSEAAHALYERVEEYKDLDGSIIALVKQMEALHQSIEALQETARMRRLNRSFHQPFNNDRDPTEHQLGALLKNIDGTHKEVRAFFESDEISLKSRSQSTIKRFFRQNTVQTKLRKFRQQYQALANTVSDISNALVSHTIQESINNPQSDNRLYAMKNRFKDPSLLTRPRTVQADARGERSRSRDQTYMCTTGNRRSVYMESCAIGSIVASPRIETAVLEEQLQKEAQNTHTESQMWLFREFENGFQHQWVDPGSFQIWYLLGKVLLWVGKCNPNFESLDETEYTKNYVHLLKAAWLVSEKIMQLFSEESNSGQFNESVLVEVQDRIYKLLPTRREPPSKDSIKKVGRDILDLGLSPAEQASIAQTETYSFGGSPEAAIYQRTVEFSGYKKEKRLIKVIFDKNGFDEASPWFNSSTMTIDDQRLLLESDGFTVQTKGGRTQYERERTTFTPIFPGPNPRERREIFIQGIEDGSRPQKSISIGIEFSDQAEVEIFQHAICGYRVEKTIPAVACALDIHRKLIGVKTRKLSNVSAQFWNPRPPPGSSVFSNANPRLARPGRRDSLLVSPVESSVGSRRFPGVSAGSSSNSSRSAAMSSRVSWVPDSRRSTCYINAPQCCRLFIHGYVGNDDSKEQLIIMKLNGDVQIKKGHCCGNKGGGESDICCPKLVLHSRANAFEVVAITPGESGKIELPLDAYSLFGQKFAKYKIKLDTVLVRFDTIEDKMGFYQHFNGSTDEYLKEIDALATTRAIGEGRLATSERFDF